MDDSVIAFLYTFYSFLSSLTTWLIIISILRIAAGVFGIVYLILHPDTAVGVSRTTWILLFVLAPLTALIVYLIFFFRAKNANNRGSLSI